MSKAFFVLLNRELGAIFLSPIAYIIFLCVSAILGFNFLAALDVIQESQGYTIIQCFFFYPLYWFAMLVLPSILTMRLFSDEYKTGAIESLLTAPVRDWDVVLAKFFASLFFYIVLWSPTVLFFSSYQFVVRNQTPFMWGPALLAYLILLLIGMFWLSIGLFASSLTKNQIISAVVSFTIIIIIFFFGFTVYRVKSDAFREGIGYFFTIQHMFDFKDGLFNTKPIVFYLTGTAFFLALTQRVVAARRLKS